MNHIYVSEFFHTYFLVHIFTYAKKYILSRSRLRRAKAPNDSKRAKLKRTTIVELLKDFILVDLLQEVSLLHLTSKEFLVWLLPLY